MYSRPRTAHNGDILKRRKIHWPTVYGGLFDEESRAQQRMQRLHRTGTLVTESAGSFCYFLFRTFFFVFVESLPLPVSQRKLDTRLIVLRLMLRRMHKCTGVSSHDGGCNVQCHPLSSRWMAKEKNKCNTDAFNTHALNIVTAPLFFCLMFYLLFLFSLYKLCQKGNGKETESKIKKKILWSELRYDCATMRSARDSGRMISLVQEADRCSALHRMNQVASQSRQTRSLSTHTHRHAGKPTPTHARLTWARVLGRWRSDVARLLFVYHVLAGKLNKRISCCEVQLNAWRGFVWLDVEGSTALSFE